MKHFYDILCIGQLRNGPRAPILQKTLFGYVVSGRVDYQFSNTAISVSACSAERCEADETIQRF